MNAGITGKDAEITDTVFDATLVSWFSAACTKSPPE